MSGRWEPDPWRRAPLRWFDGSTWTAAVFDGTSQYLDPYVPSDLTPGPVVAPSVGIVPSGNAPQAMTRAPIAVASPDPRASGATAATAAMAATEPSSSTPAAPRDAGVTAATARGASGGSSGRPASSGHPVPSRPPRWVTVLGAAVLIGVIVWFGTARWRGDDAPGGPDAGSGASVVDPAAPVTEATADAVVATTVPAVATPTTVEVEVEATTAPAVDESLVQDCVDVTPSSAFLGDTYSVFLWGAADQDPVVLRAMCAVLPTARLEQLSIRRDEIDLAFTGSTVASTDPVDPVPDANLPSTTGPVAGTAPPTAPPTTLPMEAPVTAAP